MKTNFSICVVIYKNADVLLAMLSSLVPFVTDADEILIHDNYPKSKDFDLIKTLELKLGLEIRYSSSVENLGFGAACNLLSQKATNDRLIFLNPDTQTHSFDRKIHAPGLIIGPYVYHVDGKRQVSSGSTRTVKDEFRMRWLRNFEYNSAQDPLDYVSGVALSIDREVFLDLGGFDDKFFMYYEDADLCLRAKNLGIKSRIDDRWKIEHVGGSSAKKIRTESEKRNFDSAILFHRKWNHHWRIFGLLCLVDSILRIPYHLFRGDMNQAKSFISLSKYIFGKRRLLFPHFKTA